jgi:3-amino-5-hydroxybenzoate synthase
MNEFSASVLRAQLARLDGQVEMRERRWRLLSELLGDIPGVRPQARDEQCDRNPHYMAMFRVPGLTEHDRNALVDALVGRGVPAFAAFRAIYRVEGFWERSAPTETLEQIAARCPVTEELYQDCVWLHHRILLGTEQDMHDTAAILAETLAQR